MNDIYDQLKDALVAEAAGHNLLGEKIEITCRPLSVTEAIGTPEHDDYPIVKGRETMVAAQCNNATGQAFTDEYGETSLSVAELIRLDLTTTRNRALFVAGFNAVFRSIGKCDKTVHCKDKEPVECARHLATLEAFQGKKILLVGLQPRFLEYLSKQNEVRVLDLDMDNVGQERFGVMVEHGRNFRAAARWCDLVFATGSTLVNGSIQEILDGGKPVVFFGVTISGPATVLNLSTYCHCGH